MSSSGEPLYSTYISDEIQNSENGKFISGTVTTNGAVTIGSNVESKRLTNSDRSSEILEEAKTVVTYDKLKSNKQGPDNHVSTLHKRKSFTVNVKANVNNKASLSFDGEKASKVKKCSEANNEYYLGSPGPSGKRTFCRTGTTVEPTSTKSSQRTSTHKKIFGSEQSTMSSSRRDKTNSKLDPKSSSPSAKYDILPESHRTKSQNSFKSRSSYDSALRRISPIKAFKGKKKSKNSVPTLDRHATRSEFAVVPSIQKPENVQQKDTGFIPIQNKNKLEEKSVQKNDESSQAILSNDVQKVTTDPIRGAALVSKLKEVTKTPKKMQSSKTILTKERDDVSK